MQNPYKDRAIMKSMISSVVISKLRDVFCFLHLEKAKPVVLDDIQLSSFQSIFNTRLNEWVDRKVASFEKYSDEPLVLESVHHAALLIKNGGKRIRPYICFLTYCTELGRDQEEALKVGVALELFHNFALVHDDLIDQGKERHGTATIHEHILEKADKYPRGDKKRVSEGMALLAGDLVFSWSHEAIREVNVLEVQEIFFKMIEEIVAGQMLDVSLVLRYEVDLKTILRKNELKTAMYSFVNPMLMGAAFAQSHSRIPFYKELGLLLGQAFQIQDDLLDVIGDRNDTGKISFIDIEDGQHTLLTQYIFEKGKARDKEILLSLFGKSLDNQSRKVLLRLFNETGATSHAEKQVSQLLSRAQEIITLSDLKIEDKARWISFVQILDKRKS